MEALRVADTKKLHAKALEQQAKDHFVTEGSKFAVLRKQALAERDLVKREQLARDAIIALQKYDVDHEALWSGYHQLEASAARHINNALDKREKFIKRDNFAKSKLGRGVRRVSVTASRVLRKVRKLKKK